MRLLAYKILIHVPNTEFPYYRGTFSINNVYLFPCRQMYVMSVTGGRRVLYGKYYVCTAGIYISRAAVEAVQCDIMFSNHTTTGNVTKRNLSHSNITKFSLIYPQPSLNLLQPNLSYLTKPKLISPNAT